MISDDKDFVNIKMIIEYDGTKYSGWQTQGKVKRKTIQGTLINSLQILFKGMDINLIGAGRTDAGVHAFGQVANFRIHSHYFWKLHLQKFKRSLNAILPQEISVKKISVVNPDFHSRYSAKGRTYSYYLSKYKRPLSMNKYYYLKKPFDLSLAKKYCSIIEGNHSFRYLCKNKTDKHDFRVLIKKAEVKLTKDDFIVFEVTANRFLHSMVRAIVGLMISVASGDLIPDDFKSRFYNNKPLKIQYAPSYGLFLKKVIY